MPSDYSRVAYVVDGDQVWRVELDFLPMYVTSPGSGAEAKYVPFTESWADTDTYNFGVGTYRVRQ